MPTIADPAPAIYVTVVYVNVMPTFAGDSAKPKSVIVAQPQNTPSIRWRWFGAGSGGRFSCRGLKCEKVECFRRGAGAVSVVAVPQKQVLPEFDAAQYQPRQPSVERAGVPMVLNEIAENREKLNGVSQRTLSFKI